MPAAAAMEHAVQSVDEVLTEPGFVGALKEFTNKHCEIFEASDENKLEYTPIFESYAKLVEEYVDKRLVEKGVDLEQFMKDLPAYMDSAEAHPRTGAVLELLSSFDSFMVRSQCPLVFALPGCGRAAAHVVMVA